MVAKDSSRSREREPSIARTCVRLNVLDYKKAEQSDQILQKYFRRVKRVKTSCVFEGCENQTNKS